MDLEKKADDLFSEFIRRRDANEWGFVKCCTCPQLDHWKEMDCGHFMSRINKSTRWEELNCGPQCRICNRIKDGMDLVFAGYLNWRHGTGTAEAMKIQSRQIRRMGKVDYQELIEKLTLKIVSL